MPDALNKGSVGTATDDRPQAAVPPWARVADVLTLVLLGAALALASGGFLRLRLGALRISASSATQAAIWAAVLIAIRHWRVRRPSMAARWWQTVKRWSRDEAIRAAVPVALTTRLAMGMLGLYGVFVFGYPPITLPFRLDRDELINLPGRWDAGWYLGIARLGYSWNPESTHQQNVAFFPAYPLMMRVVGQLFGGSMTETAVAGVLISTVAFVWALVVLYRLTRDRPVHGTADQAHAAILLLAVYPFSVFYGAVYTESLFLLAAVSAFWHVTHNRWLRVGAWGLFAGLLRPNGFLLCVPLALMALPRSRTSDAARRDTRLGRVVPLAAACAPVAGVLVFSAFVYTLTGNPFQWAEIQSTWGRSFSGLEWITSPLDYMMRYGVLTYVKDAPADTLNLAAALFVLAVMVPVTRTLGLAYGSFVVLTLIIPLTRGGVLSIGRISSTLFPIFIWLALRVPQTRRGLWVAAFAMGEGLLALLFYTWRPPY
jgi:hypothetical protein